MDSKDQTLGWPQFRSVSGFKLRLSTDLEDIRKIRDLRNEIFGKQDEATANRLDAYDLTSHHLLVEQESTGEIVGCYRLTNSLFSTDFESRENNDLSEIMSRPGAKLELSYACVRPDFRHGIVIRLLLTAIKEYARFYQISTVFGCASLKTTNPDQALQVYTILKHQKSAEKPSKIYSPLLRFYFQLGAIVLAPPFFDPEFKCFDFFMMIDSTSLLK